MARLREAILAFFDASMVEGELVVPYAKQSLVSEIHESAGVLSEQYDESGVRMRVRADPATLARLEATLA